MVFPKEEPWKIKLAEDVQATWHHRGGPTPHYLLHCVIFRGSHHHPTAPLCIMLHGIPGALLPPFVREETESRRR